MWGDDSRGRVHLHFILFKKSFGEKARNTHVDTPSGTNGQRTSGTPFHLRPATRTGPSHNPLAYLSFPIPTVPDFDG